MAIIKFERNQLTNNNTVCANTVDSILGQTAVPAMF